MDFWQRVFQAVPGGEIPEIVGFISAVFGMIMVTVAAWLWRSKPKERNAEDSERIEAMERLKRMENAERLKRIRDILIGRARAQSAFLPGGDEPGAKQAEAIIEQNIGAAISVLANEGNIDAAEAAERGDTRAADDALAAKIEKIDPERLGAAKEQATLYRQRGGLAYTDDPHAALSFYTKAAELDPEEIEGLFSLAHLQIRAGYRAASKQDPKRPVALENRMEDEWWDRRLPEDVDAAFEGAIASGPYERAGAIVHDLISNNAECRLHLIESHDHVGDLGSDSQEDALEAHLERLEIAKRLAAYDQNNLELQYDLSVSYNLIGDISAAREDRDGALKAYSQGLEIAKKLAASNPDNFACQHNVCVISDRVGDLSATCGDRDAAIAAYSDGIKIREMLSRREPSNVTWQTDLALSAWKLAATGADDWRRRLSDGLAILNRLNAENKLSVDQQEWIPSFEAALRQGEELAQSC